MALHFTLPTNLNIPKTSVSRRIIREWALTIIIIGGQLGIYLNALVINLNWNNILLPLAVLLLPNWRNLTSLRFPSGSKLMVMMFLFFTLIWIYLSAHSTAYLNRLFMFVTFFALGLASLKTDDVNMTGVIKKVWIVSLICAAIGLYLDVTGLFNHLVNHGGKDVARIMDMSKLTVGGGCCVGIASALCHPSKTGVMKWLVPSSVIFEFIVILTIGKRTPLITALACLIIYAIASKKVNWLKVITTCLGMAFLVILAIILFDSSLNIIERFSNLIEYTQSGIYDALHGTTTSGNISARYRYRYINMCLDFIQNDFTWMNMFIGAGANSLPMTDVPLLQSFVDMGLLGLIGYAGFVVILPLKTCFSKSTKHNMIVLFAAMICMYNIVSCLNSGSPYGMPQWQPVVLLVFTLAYTKNLAKKA